MLRIGICDDEEEARFVLSCALERVLERLGLEAELHEFSSGDQLQSWYEEHTGALDLIFLDIEMDGSNGMETAKKLRRQDAGLQLVFVTGYTDYVFDGYSVGALGYLMKPPADKQLAEIIQRAAAALHVQINDVFICRTKEGSYRIPKASILYFYSEKRIVNCVTADRCYSFYAHLDDAAAEAGASFVRIHQRYLVNAAAVERIDGSSVEICGQTLPISRACRQEAVLSLTRIMLD